MGDTQISGQFVGAFVESAGLVSPVFEKKAMDVLESNGVSEVDPEAWYSAEKFSNAIHQIEREAGEKTSERAGIQMIEIIPELSGLPSIEDAIEIAQQQQRESYKNFSPEAAGQIRQERLDNGNIRIAYFGGWDYPEAFTRGIIRGFAQGTEARNSVDTETVTTRDDETHAFEIIE